MDHPSGNGEAAGGRRMSQRLRQSILLTRNSFALHPENAPDRETWGGKFDFILSCIGYAVGLGTIWRFPYVCYRNGGGAFLIPYLIYMILLGMPLVLLELGYGQFSSLSPIAVWKMSPIFQGVGYGMVIISAIVCVYYNVIIAWTLYYFYRSFAWELPWKTCNNPWNTLACAGRENITNSTSGDELEDILTDKPALKLKTPSEEFWEYQVLGMKEGYEIGNIGAPRWELVVSLVVAWIFIFLCLCKGVKSSGKIFFFAGCLLVIGLASLWTLFSAALVAMINKFWVVYVTATLPYILLMVFLVRGVTLPGAIDGILYYIVPDFSQLLKFQPWAEAAQQLFYSMGAAWGALITMSSYNKFHHNFYRDGIIVAICDTLTAFLVGFVIFSTLGFMAFKTQSSITDVVTKGPGLVFVVIPEALTHMPGSTIWAIVFFIFIFTVGVDSQFGMFETVLSALFDYFPALRSRKILMTAVISVIEFLLGLPLVASGGIYVFQIMDWYCSTFSLMVLTLAECLIISWVYGTKRFYTDMTLMLGFTPSPWWGYCWMFITPIINVFVLLINIVQHTPVTYGNYEYPWWAILIGWILALVSMIPIPIVAVLKLVRSKHVGSLKEKLWEQMKPHKDWGPADGLMKHEYMKIEHPSSAAECLLTGVRSGQPVLNHVFSIPDNNHNNVAPVMNGDKHEHTENTIV